MKKLYCIDCNKELNKGAKYRGTKRCQSCAQKERFKFSHPWNYKELKYICINCNNQISKSSYYYGNKRCKYCAAQGENNNFYGKMHNINTRKKMRKLKIIHGMGHKPYSLEFSYYLKKQIKKRDNFKCQLCNKNEKILKTKKYQKGLEIHHIDYNKFNCKENNLITLCHKCNMKVNSDRNYWFAYFKYIMENK